MIRDVLYYENRINLHVSRAGRENGNAIKKLKRKIRALEKSNG